MSDRGWVKIDRQIQDNFLWNTNEPFDRGHAWIDILLSVNHKDTKFMYQGTPHNIKKGQMLTSLDKLGNRWNWGRHKTLDFLKMLEEEGMLKRDTETFNGTLLTVVNYGKFQSVGNTHSTTDSTTNNTTHSTTDSTQTRMSKNEKNEKEIYNASQNADNITRPMRGTKEWEEEWERLKQEGFDD